MADEGRPSPGTVGKRVKAKLTHGIGWATGDRRLEAEGEVELEGGDRTEEAVDEAERDVRQAHQELRSD
jgi:uncharacterized protein YjbJ (UPF0337 family)